MVEKTGRQEPAWPTGRGCQRRERERERVKEEEPRQTNELNSNKEALKANPYPGLEREPSLAPPKRPDCSPPRAGCCLQDTVAPGPTGCGLPTGSRTLTPPFGLGYLDRRVDLGYLEEGGVEQVGVMGYG